MQKSRAKSMVLVVLDAVSTVFMTDFRLEGSISNGKVALVVIQQRKQPYQMS
jgi:hypothetical protein